MQKIPTFQTSSSKFEQTLTLDNTKVDLKLYWNTRSQVWLVSIKCGTEAILHRKCVLNYPILRRNKALFPSLSGDLLFVNTTLSPVNLNYDTLNNGVSLFYITAEELKAWEEVYGI